MVRLPLPAGRVYCILMATPHKRLYRSREDRIFAGVLGGLGNYFGVDAVLLRLAWITFVILTGVVPGVLIYLLAILIVPLEPDEPRASAAGGANTATAGR